MNKKIWYWVGGVIVIIAVVVVVILAGKSSPAAEPVHVTAAVAQQSLHDLIGSGATQTCTFSIAATATSSSLSGTVYTDSGNMRGEFVKTTSAGKITSAHMIIASSIAYLWSDALSRGAKMQWSPAGATAFVKKYGDIDMDQPTTYSCADWTADQTKFTLPTDTQFIDVSRLMR